MPVVQVKGGKISAGLSISQERVVVVLMRVIDTEGIEAAQEKFRVLNELFCTEEGWAACASAVYDLFAEQQKRLHREQLAQELERARAAAPTIVQMLPSAQMGVATDGGQVGLLFMDNHGLVTKC